MLAGFLTVIGWRAGTELLGVVPRSAARSVGGPVVPGVFVSGLALVGPSLVTDPPSAASTEQFFSDE